MAPKPMQRTDITMATTPAPAAVVPDEDDEEVQVAPASRTAVVADDDAEEVVSATKTIRTRGTFDQMYGGVWYHFDGGVRTSVPTEVANYLAGFDGCLI